jgi:hypothetical protein
MTSADELRRALERIATALDALAVRWAVGGSLASAAYGEPRATNDVDLIAELDERAARAFVAALLGFYADADSAADAARRNGSFNVIDTESFIKLDVFVPRAGALGRGQLDRVRSLALVPGMREIPVLGPEDIVLQKLAWYRAGGEVSERQWRDILSVLRAQGERLDTAYLERVADAEGLRPLLDRARTNALA